MDSDLAYLWLIQSEHRKNILSRFDQSLTPTQISKRIDIGLDATLQLLWGMKLYGVVHRLNEITSNNRLYWLTTLGKRCQAMLREKLSLGPLEYRFPDIPWELYAFACYRHRAAVIKAMRDPMHASEIRRRAVVQNPTLRMSANNVRDVLKPLLRKGIACKFTEPKRTRPKYVLTDLGKTFRELLVRAPMC